MDVDDTQIAEPRIFRRDATSQYLVTLISTVVLVASLAAFVSDLRSSGMLIIVDFVLAIFSTLFLFGSLSVGPIVLYPDRVVQRGTFRSTRVHLDNAWLGVEYDEDGTKICCVRDGRNGIVFFGDDPPMTPLYEILAARLPIKEVPRDVPPPVTFDEAVGIYRSPRHARVTWSLFSGFFALIFVIVATLSIRVWVSTGNLSVDPFFLGLFAFVALGCAALRWNYSYRVELSANEVTYHHWPRKVKRLTLNKDTTIHWLRRYSGSRLVVESGGDSLSITCQLDDFERLAAGLSARFPGRDDDTSVALPILIRSRWYWLAFHVVFAILSWVFVGYSLWTASAHPSGGEILAILPFAALAAYVSLGISLYTRIDEHGVRSVYPLRVRYVPRERIVTVHVRTVITSGIPVPHLVIATTNGRIIDIDETFAPVSAYGLARTLRQVYGLDESALVD